METSNVRDGKFYKLPPEKENTTKETYIRIHTKSMSSPLQKRLVPNFSTLTVNLLGQKGLTDSSSSYLSLLEE